MTLFQSAPGLTVGRCHCSECATRTSTSFNPRPASRSGDALAVGVTMFAPFSFNPRPASRSGDALVRAGILLRPRVSIRARPHGRAMPFFPPQRLLPLWFQSAPGLTVGRCCSAESPQTMPDRFNPRPASRSGDAHQSARPAHGMTLFQSAPGLTVGRCAGAVAGGQQQAGFNPRPASRLGDASFAGGDDPCARGFNPRPASRSGDARTFV